MNETWAIPGLRDAEGWRLLEQAPDGTWTAWRREGDGWVTRTGYTPVGPDTNDPVTGAFAWSFIAG